MSVILELYNIFDNEYSKHIKRKASQNSVVLEISDNLAFLRVGLKEEIENVKIIAGIEDTQYKKAIKDATNLDNIQKKKFAVNILGDVSEFNKYQDWSTQKVIRVYSVIPTH